jgi:hypothetical protein
MFEHFKINLKRKKKNNNNKYEILTRSLFCGKRKEIITHTKQQRLILTDNK